MLTAALISAAVVLLAVLEVYDRRATRKLRAQIAVDIEARHLAGVPNVPTPEEREQPISAEVMRSARPWGPGFPRWIVAGGALLVLVFAAERIAGVRPYADGGENYTIAGPVAVALVLAATVRERWAAVLFSTVALVAIASFIDLPVREPGPMNVDEAFSLGRGGTPADAYAPRTAAALWIGWVGLAAAAGWGAWNGLFGAGVAIRQRLGTTLAALPLVLIAGYWFSEPHLAGIAASLIAWLWADLARRALLGYWTWDLLRKAGWTGVAGERPGEILVAAPTEPPTPDAP